MKEKKKAPPPYAPRHNGTEGVCEVSGSSSQKTRELESFRGIKRGSPYCSILLGFGMELTLAGKIAQYVLTPRSQLLEY